MKVHSFYRSFLKTAGILILTDATLCASVQCVPILSCSSLNALRAHFVRTGRDNGRLTTCPVHRAKRKRKDNSRLTTCPMDRAKRDQTSSHQHSQHDDSHVSYKVPPAKAPAKVFPSAEILRPEEVPALVSEPHVVTCTVPAHTIYEGPQAPTK